MAATCGVEELAQGVIEGVGLFDFLLSFGAMFICLSSAIALLKTNLLCP
jgi:hypothetical protein